MAPIWAYFEFEAHPIIKTEYTPNLEITINVIIENLLSKFEKLKNGIIEIKTRDKKNDKEGAEALIEKFINSENTSDLLKSLIASEKG